MKKFLLFFVFFVSQSNSMLRELPELTRFCCERLRDCARETGDYAEQKLIDLSEDNKKEEESLLKFYCRSEIIYKNLLCCFSGGCFGSGIAVAAACFCENTRAYNFFIEKSLNSTEILCKFLSKM